MKILHIINKLSTGGAQSLVAELAIGQMMNGDEVSILELMPSPDDTLRKRVTAVGVVMHTLHPIGNVYNPLVTFSIIPYLKGYDIIHVHLFPAQYWVAFAKLLSFSKAHIVTTEHSTNNKRRNGKFWGFVDRFVYNRYDKIIACADKALELFQKQYPTLDSCFVPNGVDTSKYWNAESYPKSEFSMNEEDFMVTMIARFDYPKRQDTIIEAIAKLPKNFHAVFAGGVPKKPNAIKCVELANSLGIADRVHFLYVRSDVPRILKTSDAIIMSSEYEGLSLSSIEGMAGGKPFISSNVNGLREVVSGAGLMFECGNADELASILSNLESDKEYYDLTVKNCLQRAAQYDIKETVSKYQKFYNECINYES